MAHAHLCACERPRFARGGRGIGFQTRRRAEGGQACFDLQCRHEGGAELSPQWIKSEPETPHACIQATAPTHSSSPCHPLLLSSPTIPLLLREPIPRPYPKMVPATLNIRSPPCTRPQGPRREPAVPSSCVRVKPRPCFLWCCWLVFPLTLQVHQSQRTASPFLKIRKRRFRLSTPISHLATNDGGAGKRKTKRKVGQEAG